MIDVLIFSGQSNMQGETESRPHTLPVPNAYEFLMRANACIELNHPVGEDLTVPSVDGLLLEQAWKKRGSLIPSFCRAYLKSREKVVAIQVAQGSTTIAKWQPETERYKLMVKKIKMGIEAAKAIDEIGHIYFVWLQGESDAIARTSHDDYLNAVIRLKDALKSEVGIEKFGIIRVGYFVSVCRWLDDDTMENRIARDETIMLAQEDAVRVDDDFVMLTDITKDLSRDKAWISTECDGHFNNNALDIIGRKAGRALSKLTK